MSTAECQEIVRNALATGLVRMPRTRTPVAAAAPSKTTVDAAYHRNWRHQRGAKSKRSWPQLKGLVGARYHAAYMALRRKEGKWL